MDTVLVIVIVSPQANSSPPWMRKGSPPEKLIFLIPASANIASPRLASSNGSRNEVLAVWKQNPPAYRC